MSDDEDDVEVGGVTQDYKCPLSLTILEDPLTSCVLSVLFSMQLLISHFMSRSVCNHSFSAKAIMEYLGQKNSVACPASGCKQMVTRASLKPNKELARQAKEAARRERARNVSDDEDDDDEVIE